MMKTRKLENGDWTPPSKIVRQRTPQELLQEVRELCARITYKPGWVLTVTARKPRIFEPWNIFVNLDYSVPSIHNPDVMQPLSTGFSMAERSLVETLARGDLLNFIKVNLFRRAELHELDEWLKLDGVCVTEPHPELQKAPDFSGLKMSIEASLSTNKEWLDESK